MSRNLLEPWKDLELTDLPNEVWKDIVDFEGSYMVSNLSGVKSLQRVIINCNGRRNPVDARIMKQFLYVRNSMVNSANINLSKEGKHSLHSIAILVGSAFLGKKKENEVYCHIDKNPFDNRLENLKILSWEDCADISLKKGRFKIDNPNFVRHQFKKQYKYVRKDIKTQEIIDTFTLGELKKQFSHQAAMVIYVIGTGKRKNNVYMNSIWERKLIEE